jgi:PP-loop superfamily ATP-utilizing enzyme
VNWQQKKVDQTEILSKICKQAKNKHREFDALIPLSGGKDSTYVLYMANKLGLNCLAYTLDMGYLSNCARDNIDRICRTLGVEHVTYHFNPKLMNELFSIFVRKTGWFCSVCMRAIQMSTFKVAEMYDIPLIIKGTSLRTELPLSKEMFQGGDPAHVLNVLKNEPFSSIRAKKSYFLCLL